MLWLDGADVSAGETQVACHELGTGASLLKKTGEGRHTQMDTEPEVDGMKVKSRDDERMRDTGAAGKACSGGDFYELPTAWVMNGQMSNEA